MGALAVVEVEVAVQIGLELIEAFVEGLAEGRGEELFLDGAVEALAEAVGLWRADLGAAVLDLVQGQKEFVEVLERAAAILAPVVGEDTLDSRMLHSYAVAEHEAVGPAEIVAVEHDSCVVLLFGAGEEGAVSVAVGGSGEFEQTVGRDSFIEAGDGSEEGVAGILGLWDERNLALSGDLGGRVAFAGGFGVAANSDGDGGIGLFSPRGRENFCFYFRVICGAMVMAAWSSASDTAWLPR